MKSNKTAYQILGIDAVVNDDAVIRSRYDTEKIKPGASVDLLGQAFNLLKDEVGRDLYNYNIGYYDTSSANELTARQIDHFRKNAAAYKFLKDFYAKNSPGDDWAPLHDVQDMITLSGELLEKINEYNKLEPDAVKELWNVYSGNGSYPLEYILSEEYTRDLTEARKAETFTADFEMPPFPDDDDEVENPRRVKKGEIGKAAEEAASKAGKLSSSDTLRDWGLYGEENLAGPGASAEPTNSTAPNPSIPTAVVKPTKPGKPKLEETGDKKISTGSIKLSRKPRKTESGGYQGIVISPAENSREIENAITSDSEWSGLKRSGMMIGRVGGDGDDKGKIIVYHPDKNVFGDGGDGRKWIGGVLADMVVARNDGSTLEGVEIGKKEKVEAPKTTEPSANGSTESTRDTLTGDTQAEESEFGLTPNDREGIRSNLTWKLTHKSCVAEKVKIEKVKPILDNPNIWLFADKEGEINNLDNAEYPDSKLGRKLLANPRIGEILARVDKEDFKLLRKGGRIGIAIDMKKAMEKEDKKTGEKILDNDNFNELKDFFKENGFKIGKDKENPNFIWVDYGKDNADKDKLKTALADIEQLGLARSIPLYKEKVKGSTQTIPLQP